MGVDAASADVLRECPMSVQRAVMARGDLATARNPSGALLKRIGDERNKQPIAFQAQKMMALTGDPKEMVEQFILENGVDEDSAEVFRGCPVSVQQAVMARGGMA